jgi:2-oxoisovalerate dehydrogenase E1 component
MTISDITSDELRKSYHFEDALLIRKVEETLLRLFSIGQLNGTVHTCIGQEYSAVAFVKQLEQDDFIFSNHRCHGHYLARTGDYRGLISELMGKKSGVSGGVGGSQNLFSGNFFSSGIQGGIVPVSAGLALANKLNGNGCIGIVFIGDGTLGEGVVYESLNMISKWEIPLLVVLENNSYAQSTPQELNIAGEILDRPRAFGIRAFESETGQLEHLFSNAKESIEYVRSECKPAFHLVHTYRLAPHSKGDDQRDPAEISNAWKEDPIQIVSKLFTSYYEKLEGTIDERINEAVEELKQEDEQTLSEYFDPSEWEETGVGSQKWEPVESLTSDSPERMISHINKAFHKMMMREEKLVFLGEDILSPYGGAFKASIGLSDNFSERVKATPISEAAIFGISNGLALGGFRPLAEIMFGDFLALGMDQLVNHAAKFYYMYNKKITCPVIIRTPMGGGRGYGPTHSQTLDKMLIGIDNLKVIALNLIIPPEDIYNTILDAETQPVVVIENKLDYARKHGVLSQKLIKDFRIESSLTQYPITRLTPPHGLPEISIITYGGVLTDVLTAAEKLFFEHEILCEVIVLTQINPLPLHCLREAVTSDSVLTVEEGSVSGGFSSDVAASLMELALDDPMSRLSIKRVARVGSLPVTIPASIKLEEKVLINPQRIVDGALKLKSGKH